MMCCYYNAAFKKMQALYGNLSVSTILLRQSVSRKGVRQEIFPGNDFDVALQIGHDNPWNAKLGHDLTAGTAGRARPFRISYDSQGFKALSPSERALKMAVRSAQLLKG